MSTKILSGAARITIDRSRWKEEHDWTIVIASLNCAREPRLFLTPQPTDSEKRANELRTSEPGSG